MPIPDDVLSLLSSTFFRHCSHRHTHIGSLLLLLLLVAVVVLEFTVRVYP